MDMHSLTPSMRTKLLTIYAGSYPNEPLPDLRGVMTPAHTLKFPLKAGDLLLTTPQSEVEARMHFHFDVMFNEPSTVVGKSVSGTLMEFADCVAKVVSSFTPFL